MLLWVCFFLFVHSCTAVIIDVYPGSKGGIAGAVNISNKSDIIQIHAGTYLGIENCNLLLLDGTTLVGVDGPDNTIIDCNHQSRCLSVFGVSSGVSIKGIQFKKGRAPSTVLRASSRHADSRRVVRSLPRRYGASNKLMFSAMVDFYLTPSGDIKLQLQQRKKPAQKNFVRDKSKATYRGASSVISTPIPDSFGGCLAIVQSVVTFSNVIIAECQSYKGGGLAAIFSTVTMIDCSVIGNGLTTSSVVDSLAGGGAYFLNASVAISNTTVANNHYTALNQGSVLGGGIFASSCWNLSFVASRLDNNSVAAGSLNLADIALGGGIFVSLSTNMMIMGPMTICNNSIIALNENSTLACNGGGVYLKDVPNLIILGGVSVSNNCIYSVGNGSAVSGGIGIFGCDNMVVSGPFEVLNNRILCLLGVSVAAGIMIASSNNVRVVGPIDISGNVVKTQNVAHTGGLYFVTADNGSIVGPITISNNQVIQVRITDFPSTPYVPPPRTNDTTHCKAVVTIMQMSGVLNDGSMNGYSPNLQCSWLLSPPPAYRAFKAFKLTFTSFDTLACADFVQLFDGATSLAPSLGMFAGSAAVKYSCKNLLPPMGIPIHSTASEVLITFASTSSSGLPLKGFSLEWSMFDINRTTGSFSMLKNNNYPLNVMGGGFSVILGSITVSDILISGNSAEAQFMGVAGGLYIQTSSTVRLINATIENNRVVAINAGGGGVALISSSSLACYNCIFRSNAAVAVDPHNSCYYTSEAILCPSAFGGALLLAYESCSAALFNTVITRGLSVCQVGNHVPCSCLGGGIAAMPLGSSVLFSNSVCMDSQSLCSNGSSCTWSSGACVHVAGANVTASFSKFVSNVAVGTGAGGGLSVAAGGTAFVLNSLFVSNAAQHGGAACVSDNGILFIQSSTFTSNDGWSIAGGIMARDDANVVVADSLFDRNTAPRASTMMSFNSDGLSLYSIINCTAITPVGSSWLLLGNADFATNTWVCAQPGTVFTQDLSDKYFSLTCIACDAGTYAVDFASSETLDYRCEPCPFGGHCVGSSIESNGLQALMGFWGSVANGTVTFYACPTEYCCPDLGRNCSFDYCEGNRIGRLCGRCPQGTGFRFFAQGCKENGDCEDSLWFAWIIIACATLGVLILLKTTGNESSGMLSVLLYFYQALPLVKSTPWKHTSQLSIVVIQSLFNFAPSGDSAAGGVCLIKSMKTSQKLGARMLLQAVIFAALVAIYVVHCVLRMILRSRVKPARISHYVATAVRFGTIAYTTLVLVSLQMIQCVEIDGLWVWWWDAEIVCYEYWQKGGFVAIVVLIPLPALVIVFLWKKWRSKDELSAPWKKEIWTVLANGYRKQRCWWLGISLYRRFLLVVVLTTITDANWRGMASTTLCAIFLAVNFMMVPFQSRTSHVAESTSLFLLTLLSISTTPQLAQIAYRSSESTAHESALEWAQFVTSIAPIIGYLVLVASKLREYLVPPKKMWVGFNEVNFDGVALEMGEMFDCRHCRMSDGTGCVAHQYC